MAGYYPVFNSSFLRFLIVISVICVGCTTETDRNKAHQENTNATTISVDIDDAGEIKMSEYFSGIDYFYLESPKDRPIGRIWKIMLQENIISFYDRARKSIWVYTKEGEFLREVKIPEGRGPGEFTTVEDVIFSKDKEFHILGQFKVGVYDFNGNFLNEFKKDFWVYNFTLDKSSTGYIGYAGNSLNEGRSGEEFQGNNLVYFNESGDVNKSMLPIGSGKEHISYNIPTNFPTYNEEQLFIPHLSDTVYSLADTGIAPKYILDYGDNAIPEEVFSKRYNYNKDKHRWTRFKEEEIEGKNYVTYLSYFNETDSLIHFDIATTEDNYVVVYDKENGSAEVAKNKMTNDIDNGLTSYMYTSHKNALYTVVSSNKLINHLNEIYDKQPEEYNNLKMGKIIDVSHEVGDNNNPILMKINIRTDQ